MALLLRTCTASCLAVALLGTVACDTDEGRDGSPLGPTVVDLEPDAPTIQAMDNDGAMRPRVLVYEVNPIIHSEGDRPLHEVKGWHDPQVLASQYRDAVRSATWGAVDYEIVSRFRIDQFPPRTDGNAYDETSYLSCMSGNTDDCLPDTPYMTDLAAYYNGLDWCKEASENDIDEVWVLGAPIFGMPESQMAGDGAYWLNSTPLKVECDETLVIMAFAYHVPVGNMLHNLGHRIESHMTHAFEGWWTWWSGPTPWELFTEQSECGNTHYPPNADAEYIYDRPTPTYSGCDGWADFPSYPKDPELFEPEGVSCWDWGCDGDPQENYLTWWIQHLPHEDGESQGYQTNWYHYVFDYRADL